MRAGALLVLAALLAAGCTIVPSETAKRAAESGTVLAIKVWPAGKSRPARTWTLRCAPPGGTLAAPGRACRRIAALEAPFAPVPRDVACTAVYGGPQVAEVRGTLRGRRVKARFTRTNGCEIGRWDRLRFLFPVRLN